MKKECDVAGCFKKVNARGLCAMHYSRLKKNGSLAKPVRIHKQRKCMVTGCGGNHYGNGYCRKCYNKIKYAGTLDNFTVVALPGERWVEITGHPGMWISSEGRVKSTRMRHEKLISCKFTTCNPHERQKSMIAGDALHGNISVHMEVLRGFVPNRHGDFQAVFLNGNRADCRAENLVWYGADYLLDQAILMAEQSDSPLADCFLRFWHGEKNILNGWFEEQKIRLRRFLFTRLDRFVVPYFVDIEDCVQETIVSAFLALRRGMIKNLENLNSWMFEIAKKVLASGIRDLLPGVPMVRAGEGGREYNIADYSGWCHPSAELEAIYNEEIL